MADVPEEDGTISRFPPAVTQARIIDRMADIFEEEEAFGQMPPAEAEELSVETLGAGADEWLDVSRPSVREKIPGNAEAEEIPSDLDWNDQMFLPPQTPGESQDVTQDVFTEAGAALEGKAAPCADADSRSVTAASGERSVLEGTEEASTESPGQTVTGIPPVTPTVRDVQDIQDLGSQEGAGSVRRRQRASSEKPSPRPALAVPAEDEDWGGITLNKCLLVALVLVGVGFGIFDQDPEQLAVDSELLDKRAADEHQQGDADVPPGSSIWIDPTLEKPGGTPHTFSSLKVPVDNKSNHIQAKRVELEAQTAKLSPLVREEGRRLVKAAEGPEGREEEVGRRDGGKRKWKEEERVRQRVGEEEGRKQWDKDMGGWYKDRDKQGRHQADGKDGHRQEKDARRQRVDGDKGSRQWYKEGRGGRDGEEKRRAKEGGIEQRSEDEGDRRWGGMEGRRGDKEADRQWGGKADRRGDEERDRQWGGKEGRRDDKERERWWDKKDEWRGNEQGRQRVHEGRRGDEGSKFHGAKVSRQVDWKGGGWWDKKDGRRGDEEGDKRQEDKEWRRWWGDKEDGSKRWGNGRRRQGDGDGSGELQACGDVPSCAQREGQELFGVDLRPVTEQQLASAVAEYVRHSGLSPALAQDLTARAAPFFPGGVFAHHRERLAMFLDQLEEEVEEAAEREFGDDDAVTDFEEYVWARLVGEEAVRDRNARKQKADHWHREHGDRRAPGGTHKREREGKWSPRVREVREGGSQVTP